MCQLAHFTHRSGRIVERFGALRDDIREHGVREPIVFLNGAILDGRNRYLCARELLIEYPRVEFEGDDPLGFVISHNLHRRHLSESQRGVVAAKLANMRVGGDGSNQYSNCANWHNCTSRAEAAELLNVSKRFDQLPTGVSLEFCHIMSRVTWASI